MPARGCIFHYDGVGYCLAHPEVDDERYPALCGDHLELFMPLINMLASRKADVLVTERLMSRPRPARNHRTATPALRRGAHLNAQDEATLTWLRGAA